MKKDPGETTFHFDADDSSDEETTELRRQNFTDLGNFEKFWQESDLNTSGEEDLSEEEITHLRCGFILHQMGVSLLYNAKANVQYYELKRRYLIGSKVTSHISKPNFDAIQHWIYLTIQSLLRKCFKFKLKQKSTEKIVNEILEKVSGDIIEFSKEFNTHLRVILRLKRADKMPSEVIEIFKPLLEKIIDILKKLDTEESDIKDEIFDWTTLVRVHSDITTIAIDDFISLMSTCGLLEKMIVPNKDDRIKNLKAAKKEHKEIFDEDPVAEVISELYPNFLGGTNVKQQCTKDDRWKNIVEAHVIAQIIHVHELSIDDQPSEIFEEYIARMFYYVEHASFEYSPLVIFAQLFMKEFFDIQKKYYFRLDRVMLPDSSVHNLNNSIQFFSAIRLNMRSQKRKVSQSTEDAVFSSQMPTDSCYSSYFFEKYNPKHPGLIRRQITADNKIKVFSFSDIADQLGNYQSIYKEILDLRKMINETPFLDDHELKKRNEQQIFRDSHFAQIIRKMINGDDINDVLTPLRLIPAHYQALIKLAINFITLFFGIECERNPASFITHQMILDLVIQGMSWKSALAQFNFDDGYVGGLSPMTIKDVAVVKSARSLQAMFEKHTIVPYTYKGQQQKDKDTEMWLLLVSRQFALVNEWLALSNKCFDESTESDEFIQWVKENFEIWYHLEVRDVLGQTI